MQAVYAYVYCRVGEVAGGRIWKMCVAEAVAGDLLGRHLSMPPTSMAMTRENPRSSVPHQYWSTPYTAHAEA